MSVIQKVGWEPGPELLQKLEKYRGSWVAIAGQDVVLADTDRDVLDRKIDEQHVYWDAINYVPTGDEPPLIL